MNGKWNYQLKFGIFWALFMIFSFIMIHIEEVSLISQLKDIKFWIYAVLFFVFGIFVMANLSWYIREWSIKKFKNKE